MNKIYFLLIIIFSSVTVFSQTLEQKLEGKINFREIMSIVENHFTDDEKRSPVSGFNGKKSFENNYLHWKRWEYNNLSRLDEQGNIINDASRRVWDKFREYESQNPPVNNLSYGSWSQFGPTGITRYGAGYNSGFGRVNCIAFHPSDVNTLYIGTPQGGIWKTTNHGTSWFVLTDDLPSCGISGLVVDRNNANIIYALTGDGDGSGGLVLGYGFAQQSLGVLKSTNAGVTWQLTGTFPDVTGTFYGYKLVQHPVNANTLFAVTSNGIYRTTNGGTTWIRQQAGNFTDIEFKPGDATTMYAAQRGVASPFWRSTNSGVDWSNAGITGIPTTTSRIAIGVSENNSSYVYLLTGPATGNGSFRGVYRSTNSGLAFSTRATTPNILGYPNDGSDNQHQTTYDLAIDIDPGNANTVLTGGINIWKSTDGGAGFGTISRTQWYDDAPGPSYIHADIHNITYNPLNGDVYTCSDGGVGFSTDDGSNWTFISGNLQIMASYHADWYEANEGLLVCGTQDNGTNVKNSSASNTYRHIYGADGFDAAIKDNNTDTIVYVANGSILRTTNGGLNANDVSPAGVGFFPQLARNFNSNRVLFAGDGTRLYKSTNFGASWSSVTATATGSRALLTCPSNSDRIYCSNGTTTRRTDNANNSAGTITFTLISGRPGYPAGQTLTDMAVRPANSLQVYACFGGFSAGNKVIVSTDGGDNWTNISGTLPNVPAQSIEVDANNNVYVGTDVGVFVRTTTMSDWQPFYNFMPKAPVSEIMINNTTGRIIACTFGRGNFISDIWTACVDNLTLSGFTSGNRFYNANVSVSSTTVIEQGVGNNVAYKAGSFVQLNPGFEVKNNSEFVAYNGPCNSGGVPLFALNITEDAMDMDRMYIPAKNEVRYPFGTIESIGENKRSAILNLVKDGNYTLRISNKEGQVKEMVFTSLALPAGVKPVTWNISTPGFYYLQLFKDNEIIHFQDFQIH